MNHYYDDNTSLEHHYETLSYTLRQQKMQFTTDNGVFSKRAIDYGTRVLLDAWEAPDIDGDYLDVGCGYGPIGLTLAKETKRHVDMCDVNARALDLARQNAQLNHLSNQVSIMLSDGYDKVERTTYASIVTNPPIRAGKAVVHRILSGAYDHLAFGGTLWAVIQKKQGAPSAIKQMEAVFGQCDIVQKSKGYYILCSKKEHRHEDHN